MKKFSLLSCMIMLLGMITLSFGQDHLLITEFSNRPNTPVNNEFVEIYNGTGATVDLTHYYLTDAPFQGDNDYVNIVDGKFTPTAYDFLAKFPDGAKIENGKFIIVALKGGDFKTTFGFDPDFELLSQSDTVPEMVSPGTNYIYSNTGFTDGSEVMILFYWDGASDLVQDVDYIVWGDTEEATCKTGVKRDGPDANTDSTTYFPDTPYTSQILLKSLSSTRLHTDGKTIQRKALAEVGETLTGGNGITGHDETSEDLANAFMEADPTPGAAYSNTVKVTFIANTATVPDTLGPTSVVQIRGAGGPLTWDGNSPTRMTNIGGDYWKVTLEFEAGADVQFKFYTNVHTTIAGGVEWEHQGWEGDVATGNRQLKVGDADTTLPLQFVNGWKGGAGQYEPPFTTNDSTTVVWVRVNMQGWDDFNAASQQIGIRGSNQVDWGQTGEISWGKTYLLNPESDHVNGGSQQYSGRFFYSNAVHVPNKYIGNKIQFKVVVHNAGAPLDEDWGNMIYNSGREDVVAVNVDTSAYWFWFDNKRPTYTFITQTIPIKQGRLNMISFNILPRDPDDLSITSMLNDLGTLLVAQDDDGKFYIPPYGVNTIGNADLSNGYQVYITGTADDTVMNEGDPLVPQDYSQALNNTKLFMIGYPYQNPHPVTDVFASIASSVVVVQDDEGRFWIPSYGVNTIGNMQPGKGYQIYASQTVNFAYPALPGGLAKATEPVAELPEPNHFQFQRTGLPYGIVITGSEEKLIVGDEVGVFSGDLCVGASVFTGDYPVVIASWEGNEEYSLLGFKTGESISFRVWRNSESQEVDIVERFANMSEATFRGGSISAANLGAFVLPEIIPTTYSLDQNYPNPFNPATMIEYQLPQASQVHLRIYNLLGQEIRTLVDEQKEAGYHQIKWDGKDASGREASSGIYLYSIQAGEFQAIRKMVKIE